MDNRMLAIGIATVFILCATAGAVVVMNDNGSSDVNNSSDCVASTSFGSYSNYASESDADSYKTVLMEDSDKANGTAKFLNTYSTLGVTLTQENVADNLQRAY